MKSLSHVRLFATPWTVAYQASPSMGFSRQEYWSGVPFSSPGDLPAPGIEPGSSALEADALTSEPPGKPLGEDLNLLGQPPGSAFQRQAVGGKKPSLLLPRKRLGELELWNQTDQHSTWPVAEDLDTFLCFPVWVFSCGK